MSTSGLYSSLQMRGRRALRPPSAVARAHMPGWTARTGRTFRVTRALARRLDHVAYPKPA